MFGDDVERYLRAVKESDWSSFAWRIVATTADDPSLFVIAVEATGPEGFPDFLARPQGANLFLLDTGGTRTQGQMQVRMGIGGTGIWALGG